MTITQLRYLVALDKHKSFAKAANECFVAQPTLSLQIQKLEQEIGIELFDRKKNPVVTTTYGKEVVEQAKAVLREASKIETLAQKKSSEPLGTMSVGIIPTVASYLLPLLFPALKKAAPRLQVHYSELPTSEIIKKLGEESLDLGVLATPLHQKNLIELPLYYEEFLVYFPRTYKGKTKDLDWSDLNDEDMILLSEDHCFRTQTLRVCGKAVTSHFECASLDTVKKIVDSNGGVTLLPELALEKEMIGKVGRFQAPEPVREVSLVYKTGFFKQHLLKAMQTAILGSIPKDFQSKKGRKLIGAV